MGRHGLARPLRGARAGLILAATVVALLSFPALSSAAFSWSGPLARDTVGTGPGLDTVACPSTTLCESLDTSGGEVSFAPAAPVDANPVPADPSVPIASTCPAANLCVAVDGAGNEVNFDPGRPGSARAHSIDASQILTAVTCLSTAYCVAGDVAGNEVTFNPGNPAAAAVHSLDPGEYLTGIACYAPSGTGQGDCVAIDGASKEVTFNSDDGTVKAESTIDFSNGGSTPLTAVVCPSSTKCLAFDGKGTEIAFVPTGGSITSFTLDATFGILAATCPSSTECVAIDSGGGEVTFPPGAHGTRAVIDPAKAIQAMSCPSASLCVAVRSDGQEIHFDPTSGSASAPTLVDSVGSYAAVACASSVQCTGVDLSGNAVTFDPKTRAVTASGAVDPGAQEIYSMACPLSTQCTLVDQNGTEVTFNPRAPSNHISKQLVKSHPLLGVACPAASQCTAVDDDRDEITFDPQAPSLATFALLGTPAGTSITGVACPSTSQCIAVDGGGEAVTFNPHTPGKPKPHSVLSDAGVAIACPSTWECVAVSATGQRATFRPANLSAAVTSHVDSSQPTSLACLTTTACAVIDSSGADVEFDPHGDGATARRPVGDHASMTGLACGSAERCVTVDASGEAFVGIGLLPALPRATGRPSVRGTATQGDVLTAVNGRWSNTPTSFNPQWERCAARGSACKAIRGATSHAYKLIAADVGHTIRLNEQGANQAGYGPHQLSATTRKVGYSFVPMLTRLAFSSLRGKRPELRFTLSAARFAPLLRSLIVSLPAGMRFSAPPRKPGAGARRPRGGLTIASRGRALSFSYSAVRGGVHIALRRPARSLVLVLRAPQLVVTKGLTRQLSHRTRTLVLTVTVLNRGRRLRTTAKDKVR